MDVDLVLVLGHDAGSTALEFLRDEFVFVARVNRRCRCLFRDVLGSTSTSVSSCFTSLPRLLDSGVLGDRRLEKDAYVFNSRSIEVLEFAEKNRVVPSLNKALACAIRRADVGVIDWLEGTRFEAHGPACMIAAVESGSMDMVRRFCRDGVLDHRAPNFFDDECHVYNLRVRDRVEVCRRWRQYVGDYLIEAAINGGHFEILRWLESQRIPDPREEKGAVGAAARNGSAEMVRWMLSRGYRMSPDELSESGGGVSRGDYVRWMREIGNL